MPPRPKQWLITGASGLLGHELCKALSHAGKAVDGIFGQHDLPQGVSGHKVDLLDFKAIPPLLDAVGPDVVIHAAGLTNVDACEENEDKAHALHAGAAEVMADWSRRKGAQFVLISTDHLWDGTKAMVTEDEPRKPLNAYARSKMVAEDKVAAVNEKSLIVRTNFFGAGPVWRQSISDWVIDNLVADRPISAFSDVFFTPIATPLLASFLLDLVSEKAQGVYHLCGGERVSKYEFALAVARLKGFDESLVREGSVKDAALAAPRPNDMSLATDKAAALLARPLPSLNESLKAIF